MQTRVSHLTPIQVHAFYTVPQVARILHYNPKYLRRLVEDGSIRSCRIHPSRKKTRLLIPKSEVQRLLLDIPNKNYQTLLTDLRAIR